MVIVRTAIYARISDDREETQAGVGRQVEDCKALCDARGWKYTDEHIYVDNDLSAYKKNVVRPEYERMLSDIKDGLIDAVVVYHQDRLTRQPRQLEEFVDVCQAAHLTRLASVTGDTDISSDDGLLKLRILGAVSRNQSDAQSRRIRRKAQALAMEGKVGGGGSRPFGFEDDRVTVRESEAAIIRDLAERLLAGATLRSLTMGLNDRGVTTTTGNEWHPNVLRRLLRSARISGQREHKGEIVATAVWPAIITADQTRRIRALFDDPSRRATRPPQKYLLTNILRCGVCRAALIARPREDGSRRYVCGKGPGLAGCGRTYVLGEPIEEFVTEAALTALDSSELAERLNGHRRDSGDELSEQIETLISQLDELAAAYPSQITMREWLIAREPLQQQLDDARRRQSRRTATGLLAQHLGRATELRERWPDLPFDRRHAIVRAVVAEVLVRRGRRGYNRFDPDRFELVWRH